MPSKEFWDRVLPQSSRQASHVMHSVDMLGALPGAMGNAGGSYLQVACLESFLVHARLLIEFLLVHRANPVKDFSARDFGWNGPSTSDWSHLETVWVIASRHVVHFSADRAPESVRDVQEVDTSVAGLCAIAADVLDVFELFVADLETRSCDGHAIFYRALEKARAKLATARET